MNSAAAPISRAQVTGPRFPPLPAVLLPSVLALVAVFAASILAYGTRAGWAQYANGIDTIILVRRIQWLLVGTALLSCLSLVTLVMANRATVWWLLALAVVLALFMVRFSPRYAQAITALDGPAMVVANDPRAPRPQDWVVGVVFEGEPYAFPYRALFGTPMVVVSDYSKRMLLVWSAYANRAIAANITRDLRPRALEVVSTPADALLIFDRRYGQFISSITGRTIDGARPYGFSEPIRVTQTTWSEWRARHPETRVMIPSTRAAGAPTQPILPLAQLPRRATSDLQPKTPIAMIGIDPPIAVRSDLPLNTPLNLVAGQTRLLLLRDPRSGAIRAFERRVSEDLFPLFLQRKDLRQIPAAVLIDSDTQSLWTADGKAVHGPLKGEQLREIPVDDGLYWGVMKFWYPQLALLRPDAP